MHRDFFSFLKTALTKFSLNCFLMPLPPSTILYLAEGDPAISKFLENLIDILLCYEFMTNS